MKNKLLILFFSYIAAGAIIVVVEEDALFKNVPVCTDSDSLDISSNGFDTDFNFPCPGSSGFTRTTQASAKTIFGLLENYPGPDLELSGNRPPLYLLYHNFLIYDAA